MGGTISFDEAAAFVRVVDAGSFTIAAARAGVPKSTLSRAVTRLEERARAKLLVRTTRSMSLTEAGRAFYDKIAPHVGGFDDAVRALDDDEEGEPRGVLRVTAPTDVATTYLGDAIGRFSARYPLVQMEIDLTGRIVDLVKEGFDVALRASLKPIEGPFVAKKLHTTDAHLFSAPSYLAKRGTPRDVKGLAAHDVVLFRPRSGHNPFTRADAPPGTAPHAWPTREASDLPDARIVCNDFALVRSLLLAGAGIGVLPAFLATKDLAAGTLARVLPEWSTRTGTLFFVYPQARHVPAKTRAFRDFMLESCKNA